MKMNYVPYLKNLELEGARMNAQQGDFFFADYLCVTGGIRHSPVFVIGCDGDKEDIIICSCTTQPPRGKFDIKVQLKEITYVRTNKIYTIQRAQSLFPIPQKAANKEFKSIMGSIKAILNL